MGGLLLLAVIFLCGALLFIHRSDEHKEKDFFNAVRENKIPIRIVWFSLLVLSVIISGALIIEGIDMSYSSI